MTAAVTVVVIAAIAIECATIVIAVVLIAAVVTAGLRHVTVVASHAAMTGSDTSGTARAYVAIVATVEAIAHSEVLAVTGQCWAEVVGTSVIIAVSAVHVPAVATPIGSIEMGASIVEIVAVGIAGIDAEMPVARAPVEGAVEVGGCDIGIPLPIIEDVAQVEVTTLPEGTVHIVYAGDTHEVVEVDFVCCLILGIGQVELVGHLVGEEQGFVAGLLVAHGRCRNRHGQ